MVVETTKLSVGLFLSDSEYIDWKHSAILNKAAELAVAFGKLYLLCRVGLEVFIIDIHINNH